MSFRLFLLVSLWAMSIEKQVLAQAAPEPDRLDVVAKLQNLQRERERLVATGNGLVARDQTIRNYILGAEMQALYASIMANSIPRFTVAATSNSTSKGRSSSSSSSSDRTRTSTTYYRDNSGAIASSMATAQVMYLLSLHHRFELAKNNVEFKKLLEDIGDNSHGFRLLADPLANRSLTEQRAVEVATLNWSTADQFHVGAALVRGLALRSLGREDEAYVELDKAAEFPTVAMPIALAAYGQMLHAKGSTKEAFKHLNKAVGMAGKYKADEPLLLRALCYCADNDFGDADDDLETALRLNPNCGQAHRLRSLIASTANGSARNVSKGIEWAQKAVDMSLHTDWSAFEALAIAQYQAGSKELALKTLDSAMPRAKGWQITALQERRKMIESGAILSLNWKRMSQGIVGVGRDEKIVASAPTAPGLMELAVKPAVPAVPAAVPDAPKPGLPIPGLPAEITPERIQILRSCKVASSRFTWKTVAAGKAVPLQVDLTCDSVAPIDLTRIERQYLTIQRWIERLDGDSEIANIPEKTVQRGRQRGAGGELLSGIQRIVPGATVTHFATVSFPDTLAGGRYRLLTELKLGTAVISTFSFDFDLQAK